MIELPIFPDTLPPEWMEGYRYKEIRLEQGDGDRLVKVIPYRYPLDWIAKRFVNVDIQENDGTITTPGTYLTPSHNEEGYSDEQWSWIIKADLLNPLRNDPPTVVDYRPISGFQDYRVKWRGWEVCCDLAFRHSSEVPIWVLAEDGPGCMQVQACLFERFVSGRCRETMTQFAGVDRERGGRSLRAWYNSAEYRHPVNVFRWSEQDLLVYQAQWISRHLINTRSI